MKYRAISDSSVALILTDLLEGKDGNVAERAEGRGDGTDLNYVALESEFALILRQIRNSADKADPNQMEGKLAVELLKIIDGAEIPIEVLDDQGFWAYLSLGPLWPVVQWREPPGKRKLERYVIYVDGRNSRESVLPRMYIRARIAQAAGDEQLAYSQVQAVDFWRSHITRVRTGMHPILAGAFASMQGDKKRRLKTDPLREHASLITRRWSNQVLYLLDAQECDDLVNEERPS